MSKILKYILYSDMISTADGEWVKWADVEKRIKYLEDQLAEAIKSELNQIISRLQLEAEKKENEAIQPHENEKWFYGVAEGLKEAGDIVVFYRNRAIKKQGERAMSEQSSGTPADESDRYAGDCATCGGPVFYRNGKYGEYDHECKKHNDQTQGGCPERKNMNNEETQAGQASPEAPCSASSPPPKKDGWNHSEQVLVYYEGNEQRVSRFSVAYYHYAPPFEEERWIDHSGYCYNRNPLYWWPLPSLPNRAITNKETSDE